MSPPSSPQSKLLSEILTRAASDIEFRRRLLTEPVGAIRDAFGVDIPAGYRVQFIEKGPDVDSLIVLPDVAVQPQATDEALSDEELEDVAGGVNGQGSDAGVDPEPGFWAF